MDLLGSCEMSESEVPCRLNPAQSNCELSNFGRRWGCDAPPFRAFLQRKANIGRTRGGRRAACSGPMRRRQVPVSLLRRSPDLRGNSSSGPPGRPRAVSDPGLGCSKHRRWFVICSIFWGNSPAPTPEAPLASPAHPPDLPQAHRTSDVISPDGSRAKPRPARRRTDPRMPS